MYEAGIDAGQHCSGLSLSFIAWVGAPLRRVSLFLVKNGGDFAQSLAVLSEENKVTIGCATVTATPGTVQQPVCSPDTIRHQPFIPMCRQHAGMRNGILMTVLLVLP